MFCTRFEEAGRPGFRTTRLFPIACFFAEKIISCSDAFFRAYGVDVLTFLNNAILSKISRVQSWYRKTGAGPAVDLEIQNFPMKFLGKNVFFLSFELEK